MHEAISTTALEVKQGRQFSFAYPAGRTAEDYLSTGHILVLPSGEQLRQSEDLFFVKYTTNAIVVTYGVGPTDVGGTVTLFCPLVAERGTVVLTQAQYDALTTPDEGTLYVIPDA